MAKQGPNHPGLVEKVKQTISNLNEILVCIDPKSTSTASPKKKSIARKSVPLNSEPERDKVVVKIICKVCEALQISQEELFAPGGDKFPLYMCYYFTKEFTTFTTRKIARQFGKKSNTPINNGVEYVRGLNPKIKADARMLVIIQKLENHFSKRL